MEIGLRLEGASRERQKRQKKATLIDEFKGCYGVHSRVLAETWVDLQINPIEADRIQIRKNELLAIRITRNFPNRLGQGANVYLGSAELAAIVSIEGELPTVDKYMEYMAQVNATAADTYRYLNFDQLPDFVDKASQVEISDEIRAAAAKMSQSTVAA